MEMHQVRYFLAVCDLLNFTRAAERCNVSQPALTRAIKKLEEELDGPLFRRERNLTHLTELGRMMKPHLEQSLACTLAAKATARDPTASPICFTPHGLVSCCNGCTRNLTTSSWTPRR